MVQCALHWQSIVMRWGQVQVRKSHRLHKTAYAQHNTSKEWGFSEQLEITGVFRALTINRLTQRYRHKQLRGLSTRARHAPAACALEMAPHSTCQVHQFVFSRAWDPWQPREEDCRKVWPHSKNRKHEKCSQRYVLQLCVFCTGREGKAQQRRKNGLLQVVQHD